MIPFDGPFSLGDVLNELRSANPGRGFPISLGDPDVRALAGAPTGEISMWMLRGKSGISPLSARGVNDYAFQSSAGGNGTVTCRPSVVVSGGSGARRYAWSILSTNIGVVLSNADQPSCWVQKNYSRNSIGYITTYLRCVVSDDTGSVTVDNIVAELEYSGLA